MDPKHDPEAEESEPSDPVPASKRQRKRVTMKKTQVVKRGSGRVSIRSRRRVSINPRRSSNGRRISVKAKPAKPFACDVIGCAYAGARKDYLKRHMKVHKQLFNCNSCDKKFMTQQLLTDHEPEHNDKCKFLCSVAVQGVESESDDIHEEGCPKYKSNPKKGKIDE